MDDLPPGVQIVQAHEHLPRKSSHGGKGHPAVPEGLDETEEVVAQHLEDHADVGPVRPRVLEPVQEAHAVPLVVGVPLCDLGKELDLVAGGLGVVRGRLLDFQGRCFSFWLDWRGRESEREREREREKEREKKGGGGG